MLRAAATNHDVVLLTQIGEVGAVQAKLEEEGLCVVEIIPIAGLRWLRQFEGRFGVGHLDYLIWQYRAWRVARPLQDEVDVAHHVTLSNDWLPGAVHFLNRVPVVWGPVGGAAPLSWRLARYLSVRGVAREITREALTRLIRPVTARIMARRQGVVVAVNHDTAAQFTSTTQAVMVEPHVALERAPRPPSDPEATGSSRDSPGPAVKRALFAARLSGWKGPYLALHTLACLPDEWVLDVYGLGSELRGLQRRVRQLGLEGRVRFLGHRPVDELRRALGHADVLLFPSMHDASPFTVGEAVRLGCPVVCLDVGGPPLLIAGTTGRAVPITSRVPGALADAVRAVARHQPDDRWNADRLVGAVNVWYEQARAIPSPSPLGS